MLTEMKIRRTGMMLVEPPKMRAFEDDLIGAGDFDRAGLIEFAGAAVVEAMDKAWPDMAARDQAELGAIILCGPGMKGGAGYVAGRLLRQRGWLIDVIALGDGSASPPEVTAARQRLAEVGVSVDDHDDQVRGFPGYMVENLYDVLIDAIMVASSRKPLPRGWEETLDIYGENAERLVCIDGHSGLALDTGEAFGASRAADLTVTCHLPRTGHAIADGPAMSGRLLIASNTRMSNAWNHMNRIGRHIQSQAPRIVGGPLETLDHKLAKKSSANKYDHGQVLVVAGTAERGGAARLAGRGALRAGAGLVTLAPPDLAATGPVHPDALMQRALPGADSLGAILDDERLRTVLIGPGTGLDRARALAIAALSRPDARHVHRSFLLDADALTCFADDPQTLFSLLQCRRAVLTPHEGEFARLFGPRCPEQGAIDRVRSAASRCGCTVLLKGPATIISDDLGRCRIVAAHDVPWLATGGAGDVLAGIIAGLLARRFPPLEAAATGAFLHAEAARRFGPGLIADDLPDQLPGVFRDLGL